jgi:hypothetical protein
MKLKKSAVIVIFVALILSLSVKTTFAQNETIEAAGNLMTWQFEAIKDKDYKKFIEHGNKAFKEMMDEFSFDSIVMQRRSKLIKGYKLEYIGAIRRLGMKEHLWRVLITDYKYELLGTLSLSHGRVVGFDLH